MTKNTEKASEIVKGMIVHYEHPTEGGHYRVRKVTKNTVNLGSVFGKTLYHKGVDINLIKEDEDNWYNNWRKSESYMCM